MRWMATDHPNVEIIIKQGEFADKVDEIVDISRPIQQPNIQFCRSVRLRAEPIREIQAAHAQ